MNLSSIEWGLKGLADLINIHPLFVHFPIALLLSSFAFYLLGTLLKQDQFLITGKWMLYLGTIAAGVTVWTGVEAAKTVSHGAATHEILTVHENLGFVVLGLSAILSVWAFLSQSISPKGRIPFLILFLLSALVLTQSADLGGRMVFLHGVGVSKKPSMEEVKPTIEEHHEHGANHH